MSREIIALNGGWRYAGNFEEKYIEPAFDDSGFAEVSIPHANEEIPYNYFDEKSYQYVACYRKHFALEERLKGRRIHVDFEGVMTYAKVYINGVYLGEHKGGYTPFSFDITEHAAFGGENVLTVMADSTERDDIPPFGFTIDYLTYGGIYREVSLRAVEAFSIDSVFVKPGSVLDEKKTLSADISLVNHGEAEEDITLTMELTDASGNIITVAEKKMKAEQGAVNETLEMNTLENISLWEPDAPELYKAVISIVKRGKAIDSVAVKIGFRQAEFTAEGFKLNGRPLKIMGLNRHQSFPYVGYAMPKRAQIKDADILKYELGLNLVRTSHYPQSRHFLDRCDEIGLLVLEEIPGWQHIGGAGWKEVACENVREMIVRDRNHPSIVLWGVRINESPDDHDFYVKTNDIAKNLDPTRQRGGIRCIAGSELLEDVYTMNDFVCGSDDNRTLRPQKEITGLGHEVPYLVTEYNGHMYPTKRFDQEERLNEHVLRHLRVIDAAHSDKNICGAIGWCAFDYNTHYQFGSGDRICYHGVMDMFRIPKFAAFAYKSQMDPDKEAVMEPVTLYARGERKIGGITPLTICTNCDKVELHVNSKKVGEYLPDSAGFPGLKHPPVIIEHLEGEWGHDWMDCEFVGFVGGREAVRRKYLKNSVFSDLAIEKDDETLDSGEADTTRLVIKAVDAVGNILPFADTVVSLHVKGPGRILGPESFALIGGCRAAWIRSDGTPGKITVEVKKDGKCFSDIEIQVI